LSEMPTSTSRGSHRGRLTKTRFLLSPTRDIQDRAYWLADFPVSPLTVRTTLTPGRSTLLRAWATGRRTTVLFPYKHWMGIGWVRSRRGGEKLARVRQTGQNAQSHTRARAPAPPSLSLSLSLSHRRRSCTRRTAPADRTRACCATCTPRRCPGARGRRRPCLLTPRAGGRRPGPTQRRRRWRGRPAGTASWRRGRRRSPRRRRPWRGPEVGGEGGWGGENMFGAGIFGGGGGAS